MIFQRPPTRKWLADKIYGPDHRDEFSQRDADEDEIQQIEGDAGG